MNAAILMIMPIIFLGPPKEQTVCKDCTKPACPKFLTKHLIDSEKEHIKCDSDKNWVKNGGPVTISIYGEHVTVTVNKPSGISYYRPRARAIKTSNPKITVSNTTNIFVSHNHIPIDRRSVRNTRVRPKVRTIVQSIVVTQQTTTVEVAGEQKTKVSSRTRSRVISRPVRRYRR